MKTFKTIIAFISFGVLISCNNENSEVTTPIPAFANGLNFEKIKDLGDNYFEDQMVGFLANSSNNSLYISCRDKYIGQTETIYKLDLNTLNLISKQSSLSDFVTKRNHIYNNKLYVFGASGFKQYDLNLNQDQEQVLYDNNATPNRVFSRFGSVLIDENLFIVGGFLGGESTSVTDFNKKLYKLNLNTNQFTVQSIMPKNRNGGSSEVINNKIYTFFGYEKIMNPNTSTQTVQLLNDIQIYDISANNFQTIPIPSQVKVSFTSKYNNYIFVAGNKTDGNFDSPITASYFGFLNTNTNTMTEIPITVANSTFGFPYISEIEIMNNKMYALVRESENNFSIQVANLQ